MTIIYRVKVTPETKRNKDEFVVVLERLSERWTTEPLEVELRTSFMRPKLTLLRHIAISTYFIIYLPALPTYHVRPPVLARSLPCSRVRNRNPNWRISPFTTTLPITVDSTTFPPFTRTDTLAVNMANEVNAWGFGPGKHPIFPWHSVIRRSNEPLEFV